MEDQPQRSMDDVIRDDGRYPPEAYAFLHDGLVQAVKRAHGGAFEQPGGESPQRHVTGQQMCETLRDLAVERWGMLARTVLRKWNIHATIDFGNMVYLLIRAGHMKKTDEDSIDDFRDVFGFDETFSAAAEFELNE